MRKEAFRRARFAALLAILSCALMTSQLSARVQDDDLCWEPDIEFPVPCDDEED
jgi:hypothetical protein